MSPKTKVRASKEKTYSTYLEGSNIHVSPIIWFVVAIVIGITTGVLLLLLLPQNLGLPIMTIFVIPVLLIGIPIILKERRDTKMEDAIPDVFEELSTSLRAGATIEQALLDLTKIQKGPLIDELKIALNDMEGGFSFEEAIENLISRVDVVLIKRIFKIIIDGRKAGGQLAEILDSVASDARELARLQRERQTKTLMYVIFIFAAGAVVAPLIFGFVTQIAYVVNNVSAAPAEVRSNPLDLIPNISILWVYLLIECFMSGIMLTVVRGNKIWKGLVFYSLPMAFIGTIVFEVSKVFAASMLAGAV